MNKTMLNVKIYTTGSIVLLNVCKARRTTRLLLYCFVKLVKIEGGLELLQMVEQATQLSHQIVSFELRLSKVRLVLYLPNLDACQTRSSEVGDKKLPRLVHTLSIHPFACLLLHASLPRTCDTLTSLPPPALT